MSDPTDSNGRTPSATEPPGHRSVVDHGREIQHDVQALVAAVQDAVDDLERYVTEQVERQPYLTLGVAAGVGFVLGGGLRPRLTAQVLKTATRVAFGLAASNLAARLSPGAAASVHNVSSRETLGAGKERS